MVLRWIPEAEKGRTRVESTPLSMYLRDCLDDAQQHGRPGPIGGRLAEADAALQSSLHERSLCLSVSGWIAPSATAVPRSPIRGETIARGEPRLQAIAGRDHRRRPARPMPRPLPATADHCGAAAPLHHGARDRRAPQSGAAAHVQAAASLARQAQEAVLTVFPLVLATVARTLLCSSSRKNSSRSHNTRGADRWYVAIS